MFDKRTVLILGAGASYHLNYPLGSDLVYTEKPKFNSNKYMLHKLESSDYPIVIPMCDECNSQNEARQFLVTYGYLESYNSITANEVSYSKGNGNHFFTVKPTNLPIVRDFINAIKKNPLSNIDLFLKLYPQFHTIGKDLIARCILSCEDEDHIHLGSTNNWYNILVESIISGCDKPEDIHNNKLTIVTFNYDISLDCYLYNRLSNIPFFKEEAESFLQNLEIIHVYGQIGRPSWQKSCYGDEINIPIREKDYGSYKECIALDELRKLSSGIQVIGEKKHQDLQTSTHINHIRSKIEEAEKLYILGYGFDADNSRLLLKNQEGKSILALNKEFSEKASTERELFYINYNNYRKISDQFQSSFLSKDDSITDIHNNYLYESFIGSYQRKNSGTKGDRLLTINKSHKTIYDALTSDFNL